MIEWRARLHEDPLPWLIDGTEPAVRHRALRELLDRGDDDPEVVGTCRQAMTSDPIAGILAAQDPEGWWVKPGPGYGPKYTGTVWQLMFLDQLGADPADPRIRAACEYVLEHSQAATGGFGASAEATEKPPAPRLVITCLNGNLLNALVGFGWLHDERVARAVDWQARSITGERMKYVGYTPGPGFACGANAGPCAWGATKAVLALARIPAEQRTPDAQRALDAGVAFLLARDPAVADYPTADGTSRPSGSWFRLGFPSGYVSDVLQILEAVTTAGHGADPRIDHAIDWLLDQQDERGRWANRYAYQGKMVLDVDRPGKPSRWVTFRACRVLKLAAAARAS